MRFGLVLFFIFVCGTAVAAPEGSGLGLTLSQQVYCDVKSLLGGSIGLLIGFGVALYGLMNIIQGNTAAGIMLIAGGAVVTLLPNMLESFLGGLANVMNTSKISTGATFKPASCTE